MNSPTNVKDAQNTLKQDKIKQRNSCGLLGWSRCTRRRTLTKLSKNANDTTNAKLNILNSKSNHNLPNDQCQDKIDDVKLMSRGKIQLVSYALDCLSNRINFDEL